MPSLDIAPRPGSCTSHLRMQVQDAAPVSGAFPAGAYLHLLGIGVQAVELWPYRTGPAAPRPLRLGTTAAFLACYCSLNLSTLGKPLDPGTSFRVPPGCAGDMTGRLAAQGDHRQLARMHPDRQI